ncbi:putative two-component response regulator (plasmid) [Acidiphilium multivorum AIU301]|uniref:Putative two-component response regulator n=1 Tax=Acidiphilium multivorum (strain DSM 11245 / JCM 8867 / NBRC 100883 / AIU 301) TaxID=926570 RepID=F0J7E6_ACIMA|nr:sigma-54 dependent transcriptional regulator [Acidiphilium multivorum]BAJ83013.1 putative two-component response regulator [Acidiphilium multivorum AIU301]GAN75505.1 two component transcriptional regulator sigma54 specific Fis/NtrC/NtrX [Acidiphilium multivorum AIU301]
MARIAVIDDDAGFRASLAEALDDFGHDVAEFASADLALTALATDPAALVFLDLRMPGMDGIAALEALKSRDRALPVVVLTAYATGENTIAAMRLGAFDHLTKPVGRADLEALRDRVLTGTATTSAPADSVAPGEIIGTSPAIREVQKRIGLAASGQATVLILGETGVGKELVARAIHRFSDRASRPFAAVNCAAIPADLLESELFGHERGAFTGAIGARRGRFREAEGGTILLDEIGDMAPATQAKILRVLEEREVVPLGGAPVAIDVRMIAATHRDLAERVEEGRFRADLYYRLAVLPIVVPPLRERVADIEAIARHLLARIRPASPPTLSKAALDSLSAWPWHGNVRELRNVLERAASLAPGRVIDAADLALAPSPRQTTSLPPPRRLAETVADAEIVAIRAALIRARGNRTEAARELGISRAALYDRLNRYGLTTLSENPTETVGGSDESSVV